MVKEGYQWCPTTATYGHLVQSDVLEMREDLVPIEGRPWEGDVKKCFLEAYRL